VALHALSEASASSDRGKKHELKKKTFFLLLLLLSPKLSKLRSAAVCPAVQTLCSESFFFVIFPNCFSRAGV
jgi:hypothetical protein